MLKKSLRMRSFGALQAHGRKLLKHRNVSLVLAGLSFAESCFLPLPADILLIPLCLARPGRAWHFALIATLASAVGGIYGYALGHLGYEWLDNDLVQRSSAGWLNYMVAELDSLGFLFILLAGLLPLPFRYIAISAGVSGIGILPFFLAMIISRGIQFAAISQLSALLGRSFFHETPSTN
jgi:membrane protein YqaA with SNARE-associated domain